MLGRIGFNFNQNYRSAVTFGDKAKDGIQGATQINQCDKFIADPARHKAAEKCKNYLISLDPKIKEFLDEYYARIDLQGQRLQTVITKNAMRIYHEMAELKAQAGSERPCPVSMHDTKDKATEQMEKQVQAQEDRFLINLYKRIKSLPLDDELPEVEAKPPEGAAKETEKNKALTLLIGCLNEIRHLGTSNFDLAHVQSDLFPDFVPTYISRPSPKAQEILKRLKELRQQAKSS